MNNKFFDSRFELKTPVITIKQRSAIIVVLRVKNAVRLLEEQRNNNAT